MKKQYLSIIGILLVVFAFYFFFQQETIKNYPSKGTDIIAFGDSLVYGTGASSEKKSFVSLLSAQIDQPIINLGVPGDTTQDGINRLKELDAYHPKVVILLLGGNDYLKRIPVDTTFHNLEILIQNIQARGAVVLLLGVKGSLLGDKFESRFEDLRDTYHTAYVSNVLDGILGKSSLMSDAVHPNDAGYIKIANRVYPVLSKLIEK